jgi:hypothetical protein
MPVLADVADAVANELNANNFGQQFTARRSYADWDIALEETPATKGKLYCDVVPVTYESADREDRGAIRYLVPVDVVFRKLVPSSARVPDGCVSNEFIDCLVEFNEGVYEHFMATAPRIDPAAKLVEQTWITAYGRIDAATESMLRLQSQWTGVFRLTYAVTVQI